MPVQEDVSSEAMAGRSLATAIAACLPQGARFDCGPLSERQGPLIGNEAAEIAQAVEARRMGFRAGRTCARSALRKLGIKAEAIPAAADRRPLWPEGIVGSISHSDHFAAAICARTDDFVGLGIDIEPATPLAPGLAEAICRPEERALEAPGIEDAAKLVFVIKEAFYKAYYPATRQFLDFPDARVVLGDANGFVVSLTDPDHPALAGRRTIAGRWAMAEGHLIAVAALTRD